MTNYLDLIRPGVRRTPPLPRLEIPADLQRQQWNENPYDFPADLREEVLRRLAERAWSRYPLGLRAYGVVDRLAAHHHIEPAQVVVSAGSSDIIRIVMAMLLAPGDAVVLPSPTFLLWQRNAALLDACAQTVPLDPAQDFALPVDELLDSAREHSAKLIALCAPNNPTGTVYPVEQVRRLAAESEAIVAVDEAYTDFCGADMRQLVDELPNVILVRTFSKAGAVAGLRIGYALTSPGLAQEMDKLINAFTLNPLAEAAVLVALDHAARLNEITVQNVAERERLRTAMNEMLGVYVYPSGTNFLCARLDKMANPRADAAALCAWLRTEQGVLINDMASYVELPNHIRVSVGTAAENDRLLGAMGDYLSE